MYCDKSAYYCEEPDNQKDHHEERGIRFLDVEHCSDWEELRIFIDKIG